MISSEELDRIAPKLTGQKEGSFAYYTVKDRWPKIVTKLVDQLKRDIRMISQEYGEKAEDDVKDVLEKLSKMRYLIMTDKPLENIRDCDSGTWQKLIGDQLTKDMLNQIETLTWYRGDWLFVECYLYRLIYSAFKATVNLKNYDYFFVGKQQNFYDNLPHIEESCAYLLSIVAEDAPVHETFGLKTMIKMCLWGNRADLSLTGGDNSVLHQSSMNASSQRDEFILVDDIDKLTAGHIYPLLNLKNEVSDRRIDIVLDNAGVELIGDLLLAEYFLSMGIADKVVVHGKGIPWFVSDATKKDFDWTIETLKTSVPSCKKFVDRLEQRIKDGKLLFESHKFWTYPHAYFEMQRVAPDLYEDLQKASLIFFKGDLNYRKLVGDRDWEISTPFKTACREFAPCPFMALRTLKAETVAGLSSKVVDEMTRKYEFDNKWMTSGEYGVCQLGGI